MGLGLLVLALRWACIVLNVWASFKALKEPPPRKRLPGPIRRGLADDAWAAAGGGALTTAQKARRTRMKEMVRVWLVWVLWTRLESWGERSVAWVVPFYDEIHCFLLCYMITARTSAAEVIFRRFVRPIMSPHDPWLDLTFGTLHDVLDIMIYLILRPVVLVRGWRRGKEQRKVDAAREALRADAAPSKLPARTRAPSHGSIASSAALPTQPARFPQALGLGRPSATASSSTKSSSLYPTLPALSVPSNRATVSSAPTTASSFLASSASRFPGQYVSAPAFTPLEARNPLKPVVWGKTPAQAHLEKSLRASLGSVSGRTSTASIQEPENGMGIHSTPLPWNGQTLEGPTPDDTAQLSASGGRGQGFEGLHAEHTTDEGNVTVPAGFAGDLTLLAGYRSPEPEHPSGRASPASDSLPIAVQGKGERASRTGRPVSSTTDKVRGCTLGQTKGARAVSASSGPSRKPRPTGAKRAARPDAVTQASLVIAEEPIFPAQSEGSTETAHASPGREKQRLANGQSAVQPGAGEPVVGGLSAGVSTSRDMGIAASQQRQPSPGSTSKGQPDFDISWMPRSLSGAFPSHSEDETTVWSPTKVPPPTGKRKLHNPDEPLPTPRAWNCDEDDEEISDAREKALESLRALGEGGDNDSLGGLGFGRPRKRSKINSDIISKLPGRDGARVDPTAAAPGKVRSMAARIGTAGAVNGAAGPSRGVAALNKTRSASSLGLAGRPGQQGTSRSAVHRRLPGRASGASQVTTLEDLDLTKLLPDEAKSGETTMSADSTFSTSAGDASALFGGPPPAPRARPQSFAPHPRAPRGGRSASGFTASGHPPPAPAAAVGAGAKPTGKPARKPGRATASGGAGDRTAGGVGRSVSNKAFPGAPPRPRSVSRAS